MSESAYENARYLARVGFKVFPTGRIWQHESRSIATTDMATLEAIHRIDPTCAWRIRCSREDGIVCLGAKRACDYANLVRELGPLPRTLMVARPSGTPHRLFAMGPDDPELRQGFQLFGLRAWFQSSAPIPGSMHRSGEFYHWQGGTPDQIPLARLSDEQLALLPKAGDGVTSIVTRYAEFSPSPPY